MPWGSASRWCWPTACTARAASSPPRCIGWDCSTWWPSVRTTRCGRGRAAQTLHPLAHLRAPLRRQPLFFSRSKFSPKLVRCATASAAARSSDAPDAREGPTAAGSELAEHTCLAPGEVVSLAVHPIQQLTEYRRVDPPFLVRPTHIPRLHFIQDPRRSIERRLAVPHTLSSTRCGLPLRLTCMASQHTASLTPSSLAHELGHKLEHEDLGCYDETKCFSPMLTKSWLFGPSEPIEDVGKRAHCYGHGRRGHKRLHELLPGWGWCR